MIYTPRMAHQKKALAFLKTHPQVALAMFLGSGKSLVALAHAEHLKAKRILITSDKPNVINTWPEQIYGHTDYECVVRPTSLEGINFDHPTCVCVNYEQLWHRREEYKHIPWDLWIGDESAEIKDQRRHKHRGMAIVCNNISHRVLLNGKLMTERLEDLFGQFLLVGGGPRIGRHLTSFRQRFMQPEPQGYGWIPIRSALTLIQRATKDIAYWLPDDGTIKMPERDYHVVKVPLTETQRRLDETLRLDFEAAFRGTKVETKSAGAVYQKRIQLCGGVLRGSESDWSKVPTNKTKVVRTILESNPTSKIVIWHHYVPETELLLGLCKKMGVPVSVVDSPTKTNELARFADDPTPSVLLIRTSLCKGLNQLANADIAVFYSNPLSFARRAQAEGRTRRITTTNAVTHYIDIITDSGADLSVYQLLMQKKSFSMTLANLRKFV